MAKKKLKDKIRDFVNGVKDDIKRGATSAVYLPLLPFLPIMKRALAKSGYNSSGNLQEVSERFFHEYIRNLNYDSAHVAAMRKTNAGHNFDALTVAQIANEILPIIRQIIEQFKNGDARDREAVEDSNRAAKVLTEDENENKDSGAFKQYLPLLLGALILGLILLNKKDN